LVVLCINGLLQALKSRAGDVVLLGGAEGLVVGGTGNYRNARGAYSTRLKLETIGGAFAYYDELFFRFREVEIQ
jgi:hypothetical protein